MNPEDLTVYKDPQTGGLKSLGFSIKSLFQANDFSLKHKGGNKDTKTFFENIENYSNLEVLFESTVFITGLIKDVEKNITMYLLKTSLMTVNIFVQ